LEQVINLIRPIGHFAGWEVPVEPMNTGFTGISKFSGKNLLVKSLYRSFCRMGLALSPDRHYLCCHLKKSKNRTI
jgi:hypothetical protein